MTRCLREHTCADQLWGNLYTSRSRIRAWLDEISYGLDCRNQQWCHEQDNGGSAMLRCCWWPLENDGRLHQYTD
jgi:hypothetical protein